MLLPHIFISLFLISSTCNLFAAAPSFTYKPLTRAETNHHFGSNNPIKKIFFLHQHQAYTITITNPTANAITLNSSKCIPLPINPHIATKKLSQSMAAAPWICGIGWGVFATKIIGFALIPSILLGATIIAAGVIGMNNRTLPQSTRQAITHQLIDGIHDYHINAYEENSFIIIVPRNTKQLVITHSSGNIVQPNTMLFC